MSLFEIIASDKSRIITIEDWHEHSAPFRPVLHWKDGKSAKELAEYVLQHDGIHELLENVGILYNGFFLCYPEHVTGLPGMGNGRNHDLLIASENNNILIGVEAKTDESFGPYCKSIKNPSENKKYRLASMNELVFKDKNFDCSEIRYQLLTAAAGTILEAEKLGSKQVYLVILVFEKKGYLYNETQMRRNEADFKNFKKVLSSTNSELSLLYIHKKIDY